MGLYDDIVAKYNPTAVQQPAQSKPFVGPVKQQTVQTTKSTPALTPPPSGNPYDAIVAKYAQPVPGTPQYYARTREESNKKINEELEKEKNKPWYKKAASFVTDTFRPSNIAATAKNVVQDIKKDPVGTASAVPIGLFDSGSVILNNTAKLGDAALRGITNPIIKILSGAPAAPLKGGVPVFSEQLDKYKELDAVGKYGIAGDQKETDTSMALRTSATNVAGYEFGTAIVKALSAAPAVVNAAAGAKKTTSLLQNIAGNVLGGQLTSESDSIKERTKQAAFDAAFGVVMHGVEKGASKVFSKSVKPPLEAEIEAGSAATASKAAAESKAPAETIKYVAKDQILTADGKPALARTEVNVKDGRAIIYYDKSLDANPTAKKAVFDHEYGHIVDKRINGGTNLSSEISNYNGNKVNLDKVLQDFAKSQGKTTEQIAGELKVDAHLLAGEAKNEAEQFANAYAIYRQDPVAAKATAPTFTDLMEFNTQKGIIQSHITTQDTIPGIKEVLKNEPKTKGVPEEAPKKPMDERLTPRVNKTSTEKPIAHESKAPVSKKVTGTVINVNGKDYSLSGKAEKHYLSELDKSKNYIETARRVNPGSRAEATAKGEGMKMAALKRRLTGDYTPTELAHKIAEEKSNYKGKQVSVEVNGKKVNGEIISPPAFGRFKVKLADGTVVSKFGHELSDPRTNAEILKKIQGRSDSKLLEVSEVKPKPDKKPLLPAAKSEASTKPAPKKEAPPKFVGTGMKTGKFVKDRASYNPKSINAPAETEALFDRLSKNKNNFAKQRISKSNEDIKDLARMTGLSEADLIKAKPGSIANAETVTAARSLVLDKAQDLMNYLKKIDTGTATAAELKEVKDRFIKLRAMQQSVAGLRTEASNVFRSLGIELVPGEHATLTELSQILKDAGIASEGDAALFAGKVAKQIELSTLGKVGEGALRTWYAAILSGPKTTARNILSTGANIVTEYASKFANPKSWKEIPAATSGLLRGLREGVGEAKAVLKGGQTTSKLEMFGNKFERPDVFGPSKAGRTYNSIVESVGKFLNAQDTLLKTGAREMEAASLRVSVPGMDEAVAKAISKSYAESTVYHGLPRGKLIGALREGTNILRRKFPASKIIIPFVDTVANVLDRQFDYIPLFSQLRLKTSTLMRQVDVIAKDFNITGEAEKAVILQRLKDQQMGRMYLGTAVSGTAIVLASKGMVSGMGPSNFDERQQLIDSGWRPNSVKIGNTWVPYINWGPLAGIFAMAGNVHDKIKYDKSDTKSLGTLIGNGLVGWMQTQLNTSFLSGSADLFDVINGNTSPEKYLQKLGAGLIPIPAAYTQTKDMINRNAYETRSIQERIKLKLGITGSLEPKLNAFGVRVQNDMIYGMTGATETNDPVYKFLNERQLFVTKPKLGQSYTIPYSDGEKRQLTPKEYTRYVEESGREIKNMLEENIGGWENMTDEEIKKEFDQRVQEIRERVRADILVSY